MLSTSITHPSSPSPSRVASGKHAGCSSKSRRAAAARCASASSRGRTRRRRRARGTCGRSSRFLLLGSERLCNVSLVNSLVPVAVMARGSSFFFLLPRSPGVVRDGPLRVDEASRRCRVTCVLTRHTLDSGGRSPPHPPIVQPGLRTVDPILRSAQPPAACPRPQLPASQKIGAARGPKSHSRETVSQAGAARADTANQHVRALRPPAPLAAVAAERRLAQRDHLAR